MLVKWCYLNDFEVLLLYNRSSYITPVVILKKDFDRAFGTIISIDYDTLTSEYPYRFLNSGYLNLAT